LSYYHVRVGHPLNKLAVVQKSGFGLLFDVIKVELSSLIPEEQLGTAGV
jgi:hypothetical protein